MSNLIINRVIVWIACCLALPTASGALPLADSDLALDPIAVLADPDFIQQGSAVPVSELVSLSDTHYGTELDLPSLDFAVGAFEIVPPVRESLVGMSSGIGDHEEVLRITQANALSSQTFKNGPLVIKWIYSILDAAGFVEDCGSSCDDRVVSK